MELPTLTNKQQKFLLTYITNGNNATDAYKQAYDCKSMKPESINVEASKLLKNPKVTLWAEFAKKNIQNVIVDEIKYSAKDCFLELDEVQQRAKEDKGNYSQEIKAIELKGKLAGHFIDKHQVNAQGLADVLDLLK